MWCCALINLDCPRRPTIPKVPWILAVPPLSTRSLNHILSGDTFTRGIGEYYQQPSAVGNDSNIYGEFGMLLICPKHFSTRLSRRSASIGCNYNSEIRNTSVVNFPMGDDVDFDFGFHWFKFHYYNLKRPHAPVKLMLTPWLRVFYLPSIFEPSCLVLMGRRAIMRNPQ